MNAVTRERPARASLPRHLAERFRAIRALVGNTPLLAVHARVGGQVVTVHAKAEHLNLTGSIKDRMALHILERAYAEDRIRAGDTIAEATSGNTGIAFAALGRALGHPVEIYMPDWMSVERQQLIRSYGARIVPVSKAQGGFLGSIRCCEDLQATTGGIFLPRQFSNEANVDAHATTTAPEIVAQLGARGLAPHAFVAGVGTGGTVMGVGRALRARFPTVRVHPMEPAESPTLSTGTKVGHHRIQGISDEFIPPIVKLDRLDPILAVPDGDAILMAQKLAATLGLGVGISSGANFLAALEARRRLGARADAVVVTVFCDDNKKYLSTDLMREEPIRDGYVSPTVELLDYETLPRADLPYARSPYEHSL
jgi:cysteine synthase A